MAKTVKAFAAFIFRKQTRVEQILLRVAALREMLQGVVEARRRVPQPKGLDSCVGESALLVQIRQNIFVVEQMISIKNNRIFQQSTKMLIGFFLNRYFTLKRFDFHA